MNTKWKGRLPYIFAAMIIFIPSAQPQDETPAIQVIESMMRLDFEPKVQYVFPIVNSSGKQLNSILEMQILDPWDFVLADAKTPVPLDPGQTLFNLIVEDKDLRPMSPSTLAGYRLRYRILPAGEPGFPPAKGTVQIDKIMTNPHRKDRNYQLSFLVRLPEICLFPRF